MVLETIWNQPHIDSILTKYINNNDINSFKELLQNENFNIIDSDVIFFKSVEQNNIEFLNTLLKYDIIDFEKTYVFKFSDQNLSLYEYLTIKKPNDIEKLTETLVKHFISLNIDDIRYIKDHFKNNKTIMENLQKYPYIEKMNIYDIIDIYNICNNQSFDITPILKKLYNEHICYESFIDKIIDPVKSILKKDNKSDIEKFKLLKILKIMDEYKIPYKYLEPYYIG